MVAFGFFSTEVAINKKQLNQIWETFYSRRDEKSKEKLVQHYWLFVRKIANILSQRLNHKVHADELASLGVDGLYKAIERFDKDRGCKFETYAYNRIKGSMFDGLRKADWVPRSVRIRYAAVEAEKNKVEAETGQPAEITEVLKRLDVNAEEFFGHFEKFHPRSVASIEVCVNRNVDAGENKKDFNEYLSDTVTPTPDSRLLKKEFLDKLVGKSFTKQERQLVYFYYYDRLTMREIAVKLSISESRISQIHQNVLRRLKTRIDLNPNYFSENILDIITSCNSHDSLF